MRHLQPSGKTDTGIVFEILALDPGDSRCYEAQSPGTLTVSWVPRDLRPSRVSCERLKSVGDTTTIHGVTCAGTLIVVWKPDDPEGRPPLVVGRPAATRQDLAAICVEEIAAIDPADWVRLMAQSVKGAQEQAATGVVLTRPSEPSFLSRPRTYRADGTYSES